MSADLPEILAGVVSDLQACGIPADDIIAGMIGAGIDLSVATKGPTFTRRFTADLAISIGEKLDLDA